MVSLFKWEKGIIDVCDGWKKYGRKTQGGIQLQYIYQPKTREQEKEKWDIYIWNIVSITNFTWMIGWWWSKGWGWSWWVGRGGGGGLVLRKERLLQCPHFTVTVSNSLLHGIPTFFFFFMTNNITQNIITYSNIYTLIHKYNFRMGFSKESIPTAFQIIKSLLGKDCERKVFESSADIPNWKA